jgi:photosystem II stability/assembly factor-like uncharacterized protein
MPFAWTRINTGEFADRDAIISAAIDPQDALVMYAGTSSASLYKTTDGGLTWISIKTGQLPPRINQIIIDPQNHLTVYVLGDDGVYKSLDGGASWQMKNQGLGYKGYSTMTLVIDPKNGQHLTLVYASTVYTSEDGGENWHIYYEGTCPVANHSLKMDPAAQANWYIVQKSDTNSCQAGFYKSTDGGKTWTKKKELKSSPDVDRYEEILIENAIDGKTYIYSITYNAPGAFLMISADGGDNWSEVEEEFTAISPDPAGGILAKPYFGELLRYSGGIVSEKINLPGLVQTIVLMAPSDPKTIVAVGDMLTDSSGTAIQGLKISRDRGKTYDARVNGIAMNCIEIGFNPYNPSAVYLYGSCDQYNANGYYSLDDGSNWKQFLNMQGTMTHIFRHMAFDADGKTIYATSAQAGGANRLFSTVNNMDNWVAKNDPTTYHDELYFTDPVKPGTVYYLGLDQQNKPVMIPSNNGGASWDTAHASNLPLDNPDTYNISLYFDFDQGERVYIVGTDQVITSIDHGKTWSRCGSTSWIRPSFSLLAVDPRNSRHIYLATGTGVQTSTDGCLTWTTSSGGMINSPVTTLVMDLKTPDTLYAGTENGAFMSQDGGKTWGDISEGMLGNRIIYSMAINPKDNRLYATMPYGIFRLEKK